MRKEMQSTRLIDLNSKHDAFGWELLNVNTPLNWENQNDHIVEVGW